MKSLKENKNSLIIILMLFVSFLWISSYCSIKGYDLTREAMIEKISEANIDLVVREPINITNDAELAKFPGSGTKVDPYRIENYRITSTTELCGINITGTTKFFVIQNCRIDVVDIGIWIFWVADGTAKISSNICLNHALYGIDVRFSPRVQVDNNTLYNNKKNGISSFFSNNLVVANNTCILNKHDGISIRYSQSSTILNNTCYQNNNGIQILSSLNCIIKKNVCYDNTERGILLSDSINIDVHENNVTDNSLSGLDFQNSEEISIKSNILGKNFVGMNFSKTGSISVFNNTVESSSNHGILVYILNSSEIFYNTIQNNFGYGIHAESMSITTIHHNNFIQNNLGGVSQAYSKNGMNNSWYDESEKQGNYWDTWLGSGPYGIEGLSYSDDLYPLSEPTIAPTESQFAATTFLLSFLIPLLIIVFFPVLFYLYQVQQNKRRKMKDDDRRLLINNRCGKLIQSNEVGVVLLRFGIKGGEIVQKDFRGLDIEEEVFIGYSYVTIGQGQRYETGVYGPIPAPSLPDHNEIIFTFWGKDDIPGDPRMKGKQYYLVAVIFPENCNDLLVPISKMNDKLLRYIKKHKYPNRMTLEQLQYFIKIVFLSE